MAKLEDLEFEFKEIADERVVTMLDKLGQALVKIYSSLPKSVSLPNIFNVQGKVEVSKGRIEVIKQSPVRVENLTDLKKYFESLEETFSKMLLAIQAIPQPQIKLPKIEIPAQVENNNTDLLQAIHELSDKFDNLDIPKPASMGKVEELLESFINKPTYTPQPVTHVSINSLRGQFLSTLVTVSTQGTALPSSQLINRRSLIIYNGSSSTVYIGGAGVTASGTNQGFPILANTSSPSLDAGKDMILYGVVLSNTAQVNVLEISDEASGR